MKVFMFKATERRALFTQQSAASGNVNVSRTADGRGGWLGSVTRGRHLGRRYLSLYLPHAPASHVVRTRPVCPTPADGPGTAARQLGGAARRGGAHICVGRRLHAKRAVPAGCRDG